MAAGKPSFTITARVVSIDGAPPTLGHSFKFWISYFGYIDPSAAQTPVQFVLGGNETNPIVVNPSTIATIDAQYSGSLDNSFTNLWQSLMCGLICRPTQDWQDTLEIAGTIHVDETNENLPYTARLFKSLQIYGPTNATFMGLMCFRLLANGQFPTSATDPNGIPHVWPQARFLQRYMDRINQVNPNPPPRPRRIQIFQNGNPGDNDRNSWKIYYDILRHLGTTTTQAANLPWAPAEISRASDIHKFSIGLYNPPGYMFPFSPGNPGGSSPQVPDAAGIAAWAQSQVDKFVAAGYTNLSQLTHIKIADEPSEYQNDTLRAVNETWTAGGFTSNKMRDEATRQTFLTKFRDYLAAQGLTPAQVGYGSFAAVPGPVGRGKEKGTLVERTLYYWSMRWFSYLAARLYADAADALRLKIPDIQPTLSLNSYSGMMWKGLAFDPASHITSPDDGQMGHDWHELGRLGGLIGVDDYIYEFVISNNALRTFSSVRDYPSGKMAVNEVTVAKVGTVKGALLKKTLVNVGRGGSIIPMYHFGPANVFKDGVGAEDLISGPYAVADYHRLSKWLYETEDDLLAGTPPSPQVAVVAPRSTQMFNNSVQVNDSTQGNWWTGTMDYFCEALSLVTALTHANIESDWIEEDNLGNAARLATYKVIYLTAPCIPAEYQPTLSAWVSAGGTLVTFPGAGAYDRYNSPTTGITAIGGLTESAHTRQPQGNLATTPISFPIRGNQGGYGTAYPTPETWRTTVGANGGAVEATFVDNGNPAVVTKTVGSGRRVHFAYFMAQTYFQGGIGADSPQRPPTNRWSLALRKYLTHPLTLAGVVPPVTIDQPLVEGLLLKSRTSTVVTLLNWRAEPVTISGTIRGDFAGTRLEGRNGDIPCSFSGGTVTFGPMELDDCDILVVKHDASTPKTVRDSHVLKILRGAI